MRITRSHLLKNAQNAVAEQLYNNRQIVCSFLTGSLLGDDFLLGGTTDIDLVFVHDDEPAFSREIIKVTDHIHIDVSHFSQRDFQNPRQLRINSWLGCMICFDPQLMHNRNHWFDYIQASVCAHFTDPENRLMRAQPMIEQARAIWLGLNEENIVFSPSLVASYFNTLEKAANSIALLSGIPLTERRFFFQFRQRAEVIERSNLITSLKDLIADQIPDEELWLSWVPAWRAAYTAVGKLPNCPPRLHPYRQMYYEAAAEAMYSENPIAAIWPLLNSWTDAVSLLPEDSNEYSNWLEACRFLGLSVSNLSSRIYDLDVFLDQVEETLEKWARSFGIFI